MQCTLLYQNSCNGTASFIQLGFDNKTSCLSVRICFQLQNLGCQDDRLK